MDNNDKDDELNIDLGKVWPFRKKDKKGEEEKKSEKKESEEHKEHMHEEHKHPEHKRDHEHKAQPKEEKAREEKEDEGEEIDIREIGSKLKGLFGQTKTHGKRENAAEKPEQENQDRHRKPCKQPIPKPA
ncbi:hypothetical protein HYU15_00280 [Candidatus Woesearchaeota archaeon]|nr:hypothetical protein [Candidatus Woesearchaeota archaeon]